MKQMIQKSKLLCLILLMLAIAAAAQQVNQPLPQEKLQDKIYGRFLFPDSQEGWIRFRNDAPYSGKEIFNQQPELLGLSANDEMRLLMQKEDAVGNHHYRYGQYYQGVRVEMVEYTVHERNGKVYLINGDFVRTLETNVHPSLTEQEAIDIALKAVPAQEYLWEGDEELRFKIKKNDPAATLYPQPELLLVKKDVNGDMVASNYVLAYRMILFTKKPYSSQLVYVAAQTGNILRIQDLGISCSGGTAATTFNGTQTVHTRFDAEGCSGTASFQSVDDCHSDSPIYSWDDGDGELRCDADNNWTQGTSYTKQMCISSLWAMRNAFDYYNSTWNHESYDGNGGLMDVYNDYVFSDNQGNPTGKNARFEPVIDNILVGSGATTTLFTDDYNTDDILGHEFTHGVIYYAHIDPLLYMNESGALNESFADIFGEAVERFAEGTTDWLMAADKSDHEIRSFITPNDFNDPDTYYGDFWYDGSDDAGGVHTNSSVQNHMFWLLVTGGEEMNDNGITTKVEGIGFDDAIAIAWQAMMYYLNSTNGYPTARNAWIAAAADLYGNCSQQMISTGAAWEAVGIIDPDTYLNGSICGTYSSAFPLFFIASDEIRNYSLLFNQYFLPCAVTINSGANITLESGKEINLFPDFIAKSGSTFVAMIDECELSNYDPDDTKSSESEEVLLSPSIAESLIRIYPNPANQVTNIEFDWNEDTPVDLLVTDVTGRIMLTLLNHETITGLHFKKEINTGHFSNGIYMCLLKSEGRSSVQKFVIQH